MQEKKKHPKGHKDRQLVNNKLTYYYDSGLKKSKGPFLDGKMEGEWRYFRETGELWQIGNFKNDQKDGQWTRFDLDGDIEHQEVYREGKLTKI